MKLITTSACASALLTSVLYFHSADTFLKHISVAFISYVLCSQFLSSSSVVKSFENTSRLIVVIIKVKSA